MRRIVSANALLLSVSLVVSCADDKWPRPSPIPADQFVTEFDKWREDRRARLIAPGSGPVTWVGLLELHAGTTVLGIDSTQAIVLSPSDASRLAGTLTRSGDVVRFQPAPNAMAGARVADTAGVPVTAELTLRSDRTDSATVLVIGSLRMRVHGEPGTDRLWLRVWDTEHPARAEFTLPESYAPDTMWRVTALFKPFRQPREVRVADVLGGTQEFRAAGELQFRLAGKARRLTAFAESTSKTFFVMFWDSTAATTTYEGGRYLRVELPDSSGWTVIDFNRAYNPPCVFTRFSTCALPPRENRLPLGVTAGEKRAG